MEDLLKQLINKAESRGGETWLKKCLQLDLPSEQDDLRSIDPVCAAVPWLSAEPAASDDIIAVQQHSDAPLSPPPSKRSRKEKKAFSPPQIPSRKKGLTSAPSGTRSRDSHRHAAAQRSPTAASRKHRSKLNETTAVNLQEDTQKCVWIIGNEIIEEAKKRSLFRFKSDSLGFQDNLKIIWLNKVQLRAKYVFHECLLKLKNYPPPNILIVHTGSFEVGRSKTHELISEIKNMFIQLHTRLPDTKLIFSEIIPRYNWKAKNMAFLEKIRIRINKKLEKFMYSVNGKSYRHEELEGFSVGLYEECNILSGIGQDILVVGLQNMIEGGHGAC